LGELQLDIFAFLEFQGAVCACKKADGSSAMANAESITRQLSFFIY
jgi:hypothetical protein